MTRSLSKARAFLFALFLISVHSTVVLARNDTLAVLSSDMAPYEEALSGFQEALGQPADLARLSAGPLQIQGQPRVIIAFGGKAARQKYPDSSILIYCMAPGTFLTINDHSGVSVQVSMMPEPGVLLQKLKDIQPAMKRLAVLWSSPAFELYAREASQSGPKHGVEVYAEQMTKSEDLPARLRTLQGKVDALWLPPDPLLVNSANVIIITQYSLLNDVPLYTAVGGLTDEGAVASLSSSYREIGRAAGRAAKRALAGRSLPGELYPDVIAVTINRRTAAKVGMTVPNNLPGETQGKVP